MEKVHVQRLPLIIKKIFIENNILCFIFFHICKICKIHNFFLDFLLKM